MTNIDHLHNKAKMLPVKEHSEMLSQQFLLGSHIPSRVDHYTVTTNMKWKIRPTLEQKYADNIKEYLGPNSTTNTKEYKQDRLVM